jgi:RND superfamily putative drug exporter
VFLVEIGTAVALGVILDTWIVRAILVTALNLDFGGKIWWPSRLDPDEGPTAFEAAEKVDALD